MRPVRRGLRSLRSRDPPEVLNKEKARPRFAWLQAFLFPSSYRSKLLTSLKTKKPGTFVPGFFFVDKRFEISNLDLIRDIVNMIEMEEVLFQLSDKKLNPFLKI